MKKYVLMIAITLLFIYCSKLDLFKDKEEIKSKLSQEKTQQNISNYQNLKKITLKNIGINQIWDSINYPYTIQYKQITKSEKQLLITPEIVDIFTLKSDTIIRVQKDNFTFDLIANKIQIKKVIKYNKIQGECYKLSCYSKDYQICQYGENDCYNFFPTLYLIVRVRQIKKIPEIQFISEAEGFEVFKDEYDEGNYSIWINGENIDVETSVKMNFNSDVFYGKGEILDAVVIQPENLKECFKAIHYED